VHKLVMVFATLSGFVTNTGSSVRRPRTCFL